MKYRALITQRQEINNHGEVVETLERDYINYFNEIDTEVISVSAFQDNYMELIERLDINLIIFSGGGNSSPNYYLGEMSGYIQKERDLLEEKLFKIALQKKIPILGICRGMQHLNGIYGGKISYLEKIRPIGKEHKVFLISYNKTIEVNNYHNDGILKENIGKDLEVIGLDVEYNVVEGFISKKNKVLGIQWHPERKFFNNESRKITKKIIEDFLNEVTNK